MIKIVDVTIRDGGYENNWNFSLNFVDSLIRGLAEAGIEYIEVGHGYGLGGERDFGAMAHTDREYLDLINKININAKIGMFANVNICKVDDVKLAGEFGLDFLRVGFIGYRSPHPMSGLPQLVGEAKRQGMFVSVNMVLSTLYSDKDLLENLKFIEDLGSDVIYLVDSTGGMLPNEVTRKIELLKTNSNILVGFHGHQNYDLAVANSLSAVKAGADFVDGTLLGLGRDLGNAQLEILINVLEDSGYNLEIDSMKLVDLTDSVVSSLFERSRGARKQNILMAKYGVMKHSLDLAYKIAEEKKVDVREVLALMKNKNIHFPTYEEVVGYFVRGNR